MALAKLQSEVNRKLFHMLTIVYPIGYNLIPRDLGIVLAGSVVFVDIIIESIRLSYPSLNEWLLRTFKGIYRDSEKYSVSGLIWTLSGAFLTVFIFDNPKIVTTVLLYLCLGDTTAALVGTQHGKTKIGRRNKSLEGSLACFSICFLCGIFFLPWPLAFAGALVATVVEFLPLPLNDNFWMPLMSGFALTWLVRFFM
jgi:glycerol-3-phosphate acyltransferase PlsY